MKGRFRLTEPLKSARVFGIAVLLAVPGLGKRASGNTAALKWPDFLGFRTRRDAFL